MEHSGVNRTVYISENVWIEIGGEVHIRQEIIRCITGMPLI